MILTYSFCVKKAMIAFFQNLKCLKTASTKTQDGTGRKIKQALVKNKVTKSVGIVQFTTRDDTKTFLFEILRKKTYETNL